MKHTSVLVLGVISVLALTSPVIAAEKSPFKSEIVARQAVMQVAKFNIGILAAMAKGKRDYDAQLAANSAYNLHLAALMQNGAMWPKGSGLDNKAITIKTTAKPEIWSTYPAIGDKQKAWVDASKKLSAVAGNGIDALRGAIGPVGKSCKGCHDDFRAKKKK